MQTQAVSVIRIAITLSLIWLGSVACSSSSSGEENSQPSGNTSADSDTDAGNNSSTDTSAETDPNPIAGPLTGPRSYQTGFSLVSQTYILATSEFELIYTTNLEERTITRAAAEDNFQATEDMPNFLARFDAQGRIIEYRQTEDADLNAITYNDDGTFDQFQFVDTPNAIATFNYDGVNVSERINSGVDGGFFNGRTEYAYDANGNLLSATFYAGDALEGSISAEYTVDTLGRIIEIKRLGFDAGRDVFTYDSNNNLIQHDDYRSDGSLTASTVNKYERSTQPVPNLVGFRGAYDSLFNQPK